jgi:hypothetical protein
MTAPIAIHQNVGSQRSAKSKNELTSLSPTKQELSCLLKTINALFADMLLLPKRTFFIVERAAAGQIFKTNHRL